MELSAIRELIADDMQAVNRLILEQLSSDVVLINQIGAYIIKGGGKRLRPMIVLLAARASGYQGTRHIDLAAIIEFIHTATLLHDDVVDESSMRRSQETANAVWGNAASVLVGDFLYSRSFEMMVAIQRMPVMDILSSATNRIAEGEVLQLLNCHNPDATSAFLSNPAATPSSFAKRKPNSSTGRSGNEPAMLPNKARPTRLRWATASAPSVRSWTVSGSNLLSVGNTIRR